MPAALLCRQLSLTGTGEVLLILPLRKSGPERGDLQTMAFSLLRKVCTRARFIFSLAQPLLFCLSLSAHPLEPAYDAARRGIHCYEKIP